MATLPILTVSECVKQLNDILSTQVVCVEGEIQSLSISQGRWGFFALKDLKDGSVIECFTMAWRLTSDIQDGSLVRVVATPSIYAKSGRFRLVVESIELAGAGALKQLFEKLKAKLAAEGLFEPSRKRRLPKFPQTIGLIASTQSAAYSDFIKVIGQRFPHLEILSANVKVQGVGAADSVRQALKSMTTLKPLPDAIVITRGGGSLEDLMAFNDETLVRAVFMSPVPIVTAIGHERDVSLVDLVADLKASTPSNAAELLVPHRREVVSEILGYRGRMQAALAQQLIERGHQIDSYGQWFAEILGRQRLQAEQGIKRFQSASSVWFRDLTLIRQDVNNKTTILLNRLSQKMAATSEYLRAKSILIEQLHPRRLLAKGYSIVRQRSQVLQSSTALEIGSKVNITFAEGEAEAEVTAIS